MGVNNPDLNVVTGAFSYAGKYIASRLLSQGKEVRTLTGHPNRASPFGDRVRAFPLRFDAPEELASSLQGATTLYNTYWIRFPRGKVTFDVAAENTQILVTAAAQAGVRQIVHISITNASSDSPLPYFKGKALAERAVADSGLAYTILRPALIFGAEDILINNIAWFLRKFPVFPVPGTGNYPVQPVHVEDLAEAAVGFGQRCENTVQDCVGPEVYSYGELIHLIASTVGSRSKMVHIRPGLALFLSRLAGLLVRDVVLTGDEVKGLMAGHLVSENPATGSTSLKQWLEENRDTLGRRYASELARHYR